MKKIRKYFQERKHPVITVSVLLCFVTFITNLISSLKDGNIDALELRQLLDNSKGFETVVLFLIMIAFTNKKK